MTNITHWDHAAAVYAEIVREGRDVGRLIYEPAVDELLGDVSGKRVLDVGCGEGCWSRRLAERGADVYGVDGSIEMAQLARQSAADCAGQINILVANLLEPLPLPDDSFDVALANMVLMDVERIEGLLIEIGRILKPSGALIFSITHPCFFLADWVKDNDGRRIHKAVQDYLHERLENLEFWGTTLHYHRPLSCYFGALQSAGLVVESLLEPMPSDQLLKEHPTWECDCHIPSFLVARALVASSVE